MSITSLALKQNYVHVHCHIYEWRTMGKQSVSPIDVMVVITCMQ
jgi:hypothetical protein